MIKVYMIKKAALDIALETLGGASSILKMKPGTIGLSCEGPNMYNYNYNAFQAMTSQLCGEATGGLHKNSWQHH